ncbi:MAG: ABC transporter permease [Alphaproteobacteria bacterium]
MLLYLVKRLAYVAVTLVVMSVLVFAITQVMPGDVAHIVAGQFATPDVIAAIRAKLGLDAPLPAQYWHWASALLAGDLGTSLVMQRPIAGLLGDAFARSAVLGALSLACVAVLGIVLGVLSAVRYNRPLDHVVSVFTYLGISVPEFFWGIVLILVFAGYFRLFPAGGYVPIENGIGPWLSHLVLPASTLTFTLIAHVSRLTRSSMLEALASNYVRNARAKGLSEPIVIFRHALRNALLPTITVLAIDVGWLIGGIVVIENVFSFPGMGRLLMFSIERHDLPLIQASILIVTVVYCLANLAADLLYAYVNPKIRYG